MNLNVQDSIRNALQSRPTRIKESYDVVVVGGGIAGIAAAVSAARNGSRTLLMEKSVVLGGLATIGLISWYEPLCDGSGKKMISGIAEELIRLSIRYGFDCLPEGWRDGENKEQKPGRYSTYFSPNLFAMALDEYLAENHVDLILDCMAVAPVMEGRRCIGIAAEVKEGSVFYGAKAVVDTTGDASLFWQAGLPTVEGDNFLTFVSAGYYHEDIERYNADERKNMLRLRKWLTVGSDLYGNHHPETVRKIVGTTSEDITEFVLTGRKMLFDRVKNEDRNARDVSMLPSMPQFRTIRHIAGAYDFKAIDGETFDDSIGSCGDFRKAGKHYQVPYRSLYCSECDNMLSAGRMISASGDGWEVTRVIPVCGLTGQAAGLAASMAAAGGESVAELNVSELQKKLRDNGVLFV